MSKHLAVAMIDVAPLSGDDLPAKMRIAAEIDAACRGSGFFFAANHGIDLVSLETRTSKFHRVLTDEEKRRLAIHAYNPASPRNRSGYYLAVEGRKANESFCYLNPSFDAKHPRIVAETPLHEMNVWPEETAYPGWRAFYERFYWDVFELSSLLLRGFALALGKPEQFFARDFTSADTLSAVSLIRYPYLADYPPIKTAEDGTKLNFEHHKDVSLITVLYQTAVPNLQALTSAGYVNVPTSEDAFLVNCGTYMSYMTKDYYSAPTHRVAFINAERLSIPFFVHLSYSSVIQPFSPSEPGGSGGNASLAYGAYLQKGLLDLIVTNGQT